WLRRPLGGAGHHGAAGGRAADGVRRRRDRAGAGQRARRARYRSRMIIRPVRSTPMATPATPVQRTLVGASVSSSTADTTTQTAVPPAANGTMGGSRG